MTDQMPAAAVVFMPSGQRGRAAVGTTLLDAARRAGIRRFVLASSSSVYGDAKKLPKTEEIKPREIKIDVA